MDNKDFIFLSSDKNLANENFINLDRDVELLKNEAPILASVYSKPVKKDLICEAKTQCLVSFEDQYTVYTLGNFYVKPNSDRTLIASDNPTFSDAVYFYSVTDFRSQAFIHENRSYLVGNNKIYEYTFDSETTDKNVFKDSYVNSRTSSFSIYDLFGYNNVFAWNKTLQTDSNFVILSGSLEYKPGNTNIVYCNKNDDCLVQSNWKKIILSDYIEDTDFQRLDDIHLGQILTRQNDLILFRDTSSVIYSFNLETKNVTKIDIGFNISFNINFSFDKNNEYMIVKDSNNSYVYNINNNQFDLIKTYKKPNFVLFYTENFILSSTYNHYYTTISNYSLDDFATQININKTACDNYLQTFENNNVDFAKNIKYYNFNRLLFDDKKIFLFKQHKTGSINFFNVTGDPNIFRILSETKPNSQMSYWTEKK